MPTAPRTCPILHFEKQLADTSVTVRTAALNKLFENRDMRLKKFITHSNHWDFTEYIPSDANDVRTKTVISPTHFNVFKLVTPEPTIRHGITTGIAIRT